MSTSNYEGSNYEQVIGALSRLLRLYYEQVSIYREFEQELLAGGTKVTP